MLLEDEDTTSPSQRPSTALALSGRAAVAVTNVDVRAILKFWSLFAFAATIAGTVLAAPYGPRLWTTAPEPFKECATQ